MHDTRTREIEIGGRRIPYRIRRSARARRLRADLGLRTGLRVTLPEAMHESAVVPFLLAHRRWLSRAFRRMERLAEVVPYRPLTHGTSVPFLGAALTLDVAPGPPSARRLGDAVIVHVRRRTRAAVKDALKPWYRAEARRELTRIADEMARWHGLRYRKIRIGDPRSRWGSCSTAGTLSFSWRLMLAPRAVAAYLVAHELAHLEEPNHSSRFWSRVERICPNYRDEERWLKRNGPGLDL